MRVTGDQRGGAVVEVDRLETGDATHDRRDLLGRRPAEIEAMAAIHDGREHLLRLRRREHEDRPRRRLLFERLEEGVPGLAGEHVGLIEDVRPCAGPTGANPTFSRSLRMSSTELFDAGIHLDHVE